MIGKQQFQSNKMNESFTENEFYSLYKILGFGSKNNFSLSKNELNGLIAWISGPYVVFYDIVSDSQVFFLKNKNNKIISCIQFSSNGKLFATGEGNCKNGEICLYNIFYNGKTNIHKLLISYKTHKYGIDKLFFFKNDNYLLSIGNKEDKIMNIMDINNKQIIYSYIFNKTILGVDLCNDFSVICGNNFIRLYEFNFNILNKNTNYINNSNDLLIKKPVDLSKLKDKSFVYTSIYMPNIKKMQKLFFITEDCYLVELMPNNLILTRWINLKADRGYNLTIWDNNIGCGCSDGIYRIFNVDNLSHIQTLHKPPPLGPEINNINSVQNSSNFVYPDVMCNLYIKYHKKLIIVYSNKYFLVWDIKNKNQMNIVRYHVFQCGSIKCMDYAFDQKENILKIATCSDDKTVIYWNLRLDENIHNPLLDSKIKHITYSKYIRHIFYFSKNYEYFKIKNENKNIKNNNNFNEEDNMINLTSVKFSFNNQFLYIGDSIGNLHIFSLSNNFEEIIEIPAHNDKINTIDTITINSNISYLATGSSDCYVNIFDISKGFKSNLNINDFNIIFEKMSSEVLNIIFCIDKNKKLKLIVSELNSTISFYQLEKGNLLILQKHNDPNLKNYCLCYSPSINKIISGHNGKIIIWKTSSNIIHKHFQVSKGDKILDNFRIGTDSNGLIFATSNNDKNIRIRALHDGKLLSKIAVAESISNLSFILNDNYLIATSVEGYIYFYKINQNFISKLKRDKELINSIEEKNVINNKLKLLEKLLDNDVSSSKNKEVKYLVEKLQNSEDNSIEDLKRLDELVIESRKKGFKNEEIIQLKEDKPNNNDDQDNQNNDGEGDDNIIILSKSKLFEMNLKDKTSNKDNISKINNKKINQNRVSIIDNYIKKENKKNVVKKTSKYKINIIDLDLNNLNNKNQLNNSDDKKAKSPRELKFNKIGKEKSPGKKTTLNKNNPFGKNVLKTDYKNVNNKINFKNGVKKKSSCSNSNSNIAEINLKINKKKNDNHINSTKNNILNNNLKEFNIKSEQNSSFNKNYYQRKIIESKVDKNYNSLSFNKKYNKLIFCRNIRFFILKKENNKKSNIKLIKKECNFKIVNYNYNFNYNNKKKLINEIEKVNIDKINKKKDLEKFEKKLELLRDQIKIKLGTYTKINNEKEKLLDIFGSLLIDKINKEKKKK